MPKPALLLAQFLALCVAAGCSRASATTYPIHGQILAISGQTPGARVEVTLKHGDIPGFMPAMTMPYGVKDPAAVSGLSAGDVIDATLVVQGNNVHLESIRKTGRAPLPADANAVKATDVMQPGDRVPDAALVDQTGTTRSLSDWRGKVLVVTFVYTRCPLPDFCPLMDRHFGTLQQAIKKDPPLRDRAHLVSISFDPAHDTLPVIRAHATALGADPAVWSYLTGTPEAIDTMTSRFGVSTIQEKESPDTITHNLRTAIVDRNGRLVKTYTGNDWTPEALLDDLRAQIR
ncbi:MAG TPA: SCO family protein [Vicinamibacterales bacterium]